MDLHYLLQLAMQPTPWVTGFSLKLISVIILLHRKGYDYLIKDINEVSPIIGETIIEATMFFGLESNIPLTVIMYTSMCEIILIKDFFQFIEKRIKNKD